MCGTKLKIFSLALVLSLLLPSYSFSAVTYTDEQVEALKMHLDGLEKELKSAKEKLKEQGNQLSDAKIYSNELEIKLNKSRKALSEAKTSLEKLKKDSAEQKNTLQQLEKSLRQEKRQQKWTTVKVSVITFVVGLSVGAGGTYYYTHK